MTLGQEFDAFARDARRTRSARCEAIQRVLCEINMGGTAIGTGLNAPDGLRAEVRRRTWRRSRGCRSTWPQDLIEATQDTQAFVLYSSVLKSLAIKLVEGRQRPAAAVVGTALRAARDQPAGRRSPARRSCRAR